VRYAFFPGCSLDSTAWDFGRSVRAVFASLGIELQEIPEWVCCGSTPAHTSSSSLAVALPAMSLQKAKDMGLEVVTACASCYSRLRTANHKIKTSPEERDRAARVIGSSYDGSTPVRHLIDVLVNDLGLSAIREHVTAPLRGLRVACYYGCLLTRPPEIVAFDDPEHPTCMEQLIEAIGATPVEWPYKTECCGAGLSITRPDAVCRLAHRLLAMAAEAGADCLAVACPLCQANLDLRQSDAAKSHGQLEATPVPYITQLLGIAMGLPWEELGLAALSVSAEPVLQLGRAAEPSDPGGKP
jgi:heterodisulfide reductase subunit B